MNLDFFSDTFYYVQVLKESYKRKEMSEHLGTQTDPEFVS